MAEQNAEVVGQIRNLVNEVGASVIARQISGFDDFPGFFQDFLADEPGAAAEQRGGVGPGGGIGFAILDDRHELFQGR